MTDSYYTSSLKYLESLQNFEQKNYHNPEFSLQNMAKIYHKIFNNSTIPIIHIAGTKGKGSTAAFVSAMLQSAGYSVGLYTSPHLIDIRERITINNKLISKNNFAKYIFDIIKPLNDNLKTKLTYFEVLTLLALSYFNKKNVDYIILEVGLGGRLDSTNVVTPIITAITNIAFDHTHILGDTIEKITSEKAGIIKKNIPIVTTFSQNQKAMSVIENIAKENNAPLIIAPIYEGETSLVGNYQKINCGIAAAICKELGFSTENIKHGALNCHFKGRMENITEKYFPMPSKNSKTVIFDGAHNPYALNALLDSIKSVFPNKKIDFILGFLADKDWQEMVNIIINDSISNSITFVDAASDRYIKKEELLLYAKNTIGLNSIKLSISNSIEKTVLNNQSNDHIIIITGSLYLYSLL